MATRIEFVVMCDGPDCAARVVSEHSMADAKDMARRAGWRLTGIIPGDEAYCPDCHRPMLGMIRDCPDCRTARDDVVDEWGAAVPEQPRTPAALWSGLTWRV